MAGEEYDRAKLIHPQMANIILHFFYSTMDLTTNSVGLSLSHHALIILSDRPSSLSQSQLMLNYDTQVTKDHVPQSQFNYMLHVISHRMRHNFE